MNYKYSCVVDAEKNYKTLVLVLLEQDEDGQPKESIQYYELLEGESLIDTTSPSMRPHAGAVGLVRPRWSEDTATWAEGATAAKIATWEAEYHAPENTPEAVRAQRDKLLADTDWTQVLDAPIDAQSREAYRTYRQALRDVPAQEEFPAAVIWPELPAPVKAEPDPVDEAVDVLLGGDGIA